MVVKNLFWNANNGSKIDKTTLVEHTLKYGDLDDIKKLFDEFQKDEIKKIWFKTMAWDKRFLKVNLMIARIFFDMDVESDYFERLNSGRFKSEVFVK